MIIAPIAEATDWVRMSRFLMWASSWEITPRSSSSESSFVIPWVTATAECLGLRPVANAFGWSLGIMYSFGIGRSARVVSSRTIW